MKLVSACLLGIKCAWDGKDRYKNEKVIKLLNKEVLIPVCPEQLGGLTTPRPPQQIQGRSGEDVLDGKGKVINKLGEDVTQQFIRGAKETLKIAKRFKAKEFVAKNGSPACGCGKTGRIKKGNGVTTALLKRNGIKIICETEL